MTFMLRIQAIVVGKILCQKLEAAGHRKFTVRKQTEMLLRLRPRNGATHI